MTQALDLKRLSADACASYCHVMIVVVLVCHVHQGLNGIEMESHIHLAFVIISGGRYHVEDNRSRNDLIEVKMVLLVMIEIIIQEEE